MYTAPAFHALTDRRLDLASATEYTIRKKMIICFLSIGDNICKTTKKEIVAG